MIDKELLDLFQNEAQKMIDSMREGLEELKETGNDGEGGHPEHTSGHPEQTSGHPERPKGAKDLAQELFRYAHTLKGSSLRVEGFEKLHDLCEPLTEDFRAAAYGEATIPAARIPLLALAVEACQDLLNGGQVADYERLLKELKATG